jgi:large subunit ribosomal protein L22
MEVKAVEKYIRISPRKARLVADMVRGQNAKKSLVALKFMPKKAAGIIYKAVKSAVANAENNFNLDGETLVISKITVDGGPTLKRFRPAARGMAKHIRKRTSHITVVVSGEGTTKKAKPAKEAKSEQPKAADAEGSK